MSSREEVEQSLAALDAARAGPDADAEIEALAELEAAVRANLGMFRPEDQQRVLDEAIDRLERGLQVERKHERFLLSVAMQRRDLQKRAEKAEAEVARLRADAERLDYIERRFSGVTNRERYLKVEMIWGKGCNGRTLREACDKYMARDAALEPTR